MFFLKAAAAAEEEERVEEEEEVEEEERVEEEEEEKEDVWAWTSPRCSSDSTDRSPTRSQSKALDRELGRGEKGKMDGDEDKGKEEETRTRTRRTRSRTRRAHSVEQDTWSTQQDACGAQSSTLERGVGRERSMKRRKRIRTYGAGWRMLPRAQLALSARCSRGALAHRLTRCHPRPPLAPSPSPSLAPSPSPAVATPQPTLARPPRSPRRFRVNDAACAELAKVTGPVAVITVAGLYRTGKSFILNQLAGGQSGFDIGGSVGAVPLETGVARHTTDRTDMCMEPCRARALGQSRARRACGCGSSKRGSWTRRSLPRT